MKLATVPAVILNLTDLNHEVDQVLYTEDFVVGDWILLVDSFHKEPELIDHLHIFCVDPEITTPH
jgi:hypothetical protein